MKLLISGATGYVGQFILADTLAHGDDVTLLSRRPADPAAFCGGTVIPFDLADPPTSLPKADALIHAAFAHIPGRYRGGEGSDPNGFLHRNFEGSKKLFDAAANSGVKRIVFLSTRAVYGDYPAGTPLVETLRPRPDTLYGIMKSQVEQALATRADTNLCTVSLRATGVYGAASPGGAHKWQKLFAEYATGAVLSPRRATEVHGADVAQAIRLCLTADSNRISGKAFNVSDIMLDRAELLSLYATSTGVVGNIPTPAHGTEPNKMDCSALRALGWQPRGVPGLKAFLSGLARRNPPSSSS